MKIIFATKNPGKIYEMTQLLADFEIEIISSLEAGITEDIVEDGKTLEENSLKKAKYVASKTGQYAIADDSGIFVESLDGKPGIYSARWAGRNKTDKEIAHKLLNELNATNSNNRSAYFESTVVLCSPKGRNWVFTGLVEGLIAHNLRGMPKEKLPYDYIFKPYGYNKTFAELEDGVKNSISHRGKAFAQLRNFFKKSGLLKD